MSKKKTATGSKGKAAVAPPSESDLKVQAAVAAIHQKYGKSSIGTVDATSEVERFDRQYSTGSLSLDMAIGPARRHPNGVWQHGLPPGKIVEVHGPESVGKSTLCIAMGAAAQRAGRRTAFIDMEHQVDVDWCRRCHYDMSKVLFAQPNSGSEALGIVDLLVQSGEFALIFVDSVAALISDGELDGDINDSHVGEQARMMSQALRKFSVSLGHRNKTTIVFTNQLREKIQTGGRRMGDATTTPGGRALKFYANIRIKCYHDGFITMNGATKEDDGTPVPRIGQYVGIHIIKNKVATPFRNASIPLLYQRSNGSAGFDKLRELVEVAVHMGVMAGEKGRYEYPDVNGEVVKAHGIVNLLNSLGSSPADVYALYDRVWTEHQRMCGLDPTGNHLPDDQRPKDPLMDNDIDFAPPTPGADNGEDGDGDPLQADEKDDSNGQA